jgi:hypothetical protein
LVGHKTWFKPALGEAGNSISSNPGGSAIGPALAKQYGISAAGQSYSVLGKKADIIGDGVTPFREDLRQVYNVNMPYQVGQRNSEPLIMANKNSLLKTAGHTVIAPGDKPNGS